MKVKNLYVGQVSALKNIQIKIKCNDNLDPILSWISREEFISAENHYLRTSIFYKKNKNKMKDLVYGGIYPIDYDQDTAYEGFEYVSKYVSMSTAFDQETVSKKSLLKKYKEATLKYNREKNGGNNE